MSEARAFRQDVRGLRGAAAVVASGGAYLDVTPWFCAGPSCAVVVDNTLRSHVLARQM